MLGWNPGGGAAVGQAWGVVEEQAAKHGRPEPDRQSWRVLGNMHIAETRAQAKDEAMLGLQKWHNEYNVKVLGRPLTYLVWLVRPTNDDRLYIIRCWAAHRRFAAAFDVVVPPLSRVAVPVVERGYQLYARGDHGELDPGKRVRWAVIDGPFGRCRTGRAKRDAHAARSCCV